MSAAAAAWASTRKRKQIIMRQKIRLNNEGVREATRGMSPRGGDNVVFGVIVVERRQRLRAAP